MIITRKIRKVGNSLMIPLSPETISVIAAEIVEDLQTALAEFAAVAESLSRRDS
jgi:hypothetical protein